MPKQVTRLSAAGVKAAKPGRYGDGNGLYLLVRPNGSRFWLFRYKLGGKSREMGLGPAAGHNAVGLADARKRAVDLIGLVRDGTDPLVKRDADEAAAKAAQQQAAIQGKTFKDVADAYITINEAGWRNDKHRWQWRRTLEMYAFPVIGDIPVSDVTTAHVTEILEPIWLVVPETATRLRGRIELVLDYAKAREWRSGENPARWRGHIANMLPKRSRVARVEHHAALPWREMGAFMPSLAKHDSASALALQFTILTAARSGEVIGATWGEIDQKERMWNIPGERMKAGKIHRQPLSAAALAILTKAESLRGTDSPSAMVFPSNQGGAMSNMAMMMLLRRMERGDLTVHGFRSTFRDWAAESTSFPPEVAEMALAHTVSDKVEAAYRRGDLLEKRRKLMEAWGSYCTKPAADQGAVIPKREREATAAG